ncbi:MAG: hypothetical protein K8R02_06715 [Anaerohalosphaeraceae bacterium]|nr:hypothetical protein [Anaerohalosphaeraceae bacterium]
MKRFSVLIFVLCVCFVPAGALAAESKDELAMFAQASEAFSKANELANEPARAEQFYAEAILGYEKIVSDYEIHNAKLYYNLANAYFLKGDIGRAILNYRRAEKLSPGDEAIEKNLSFARSRRIDRIETPAKEMVLKTLLFWHYDFSPQARSLAACVSFAAVCVCSGFLVLRGRNNFLTAAVVLCGIVFLCLASSVVVEQACVQKQSCGVIVAEEVVARQGDGENYMASFKEPLHAGSEFELVESRGGWLHIRLGNESQGWIRVDAAELI